MNRSRAESLVRWAPERRLRIASLIGLGAMILLGTAILASAFPLAVYSISLAFFGLPHVLAELRYVDLRFTHRLSNTTAACIIVLLLAVMALRVLDFVPGFLPFSRETAELSLLVLLILAILPALSLFASMGATFSTCALIAGLLIAPAPTLVILAFLHNLTPLGFLAERLEGAARRPVLWAGFAAFVVVPLGIILAPAIGSSSWSGLLTGNVADHVGLFVPSFLHETAWAPSIFAAAAYLQVLHYFVVLHILPRWVEDRGTRHSVLAWPKRERFALIILVSGLLLAVGFGLDFALTRQVYGVVAVVHAFVEIPILLFALGPRIRARS